MDYIWSFSLYVHEKQGEASGVLTQPLGGGIIQVVKNINKAVKVFHQAGEGATWDWCSWSPNVSQWLRDLLKCGIYLAFCLAGIGFCFCSIVNCMHVCTTINYEY